MALKWRLLLLFFCCTLLSLNPAECQKNLWIQFCKQVSQPFGPNLVYKTPSLGETGFSWNNSKLLLLCTKGVPSFCKISVNMRFRIFFKIFMVVIFVRLWCPVTMQNFRKKIWSGFRSPGGQTGVFSRYLLLLLLFTYRVLSPFKISEKSLLKILKTMHIMFWDKSGVFFSTLLSTRELDML